MEWIHDLRADGDHAVTRLDTDLEYFAEQLLKIRPKAGSLEPFRFNAAQRELHRRLEEQKAKTGKVRAVVLKARQMGISTYIAARFFRQTIARPGLRYRDHRARAGSEPQSVRPGQTISTIILPDDRSPRLAPRTRRS